MTITERARSTAGKAVLLLVAVPVGALLAWLALLGSTTLPTDRPSLYLGLPIVVVVAVAVALPRLARSLPRWRTFAVVAGWAVAAGGLLTLTFFMWLFWQMGSGMEHFD